MPLVKPGGNSGQVGTFGSEQRPITKESKMRASEGDLRRLSNPNRGGRVTSGKVYVVAAMGWSGVCRRRSLDADMVLDSFGRTTADDLTRPRIEYFMLHLSSIIVEDPHPFLSRSSSTWVAVSRARLSTTMTLAGQISPLRLKRYPLAAAPVERVSWAARMELQLKP